MSDVDRFQNHITNKKSIESVKWHHDFELAPGLWTGGTYRPHGLLSRLSLPSDMTGMRVLDVGARDGFFSFECEKRGADVLAVDFVPQDATGFALAKSIVGSSVNYLHASIYELPKHNLGHFDVVLFLGVIYHLPDPYLALEIVYSLTRSNGTAFIESTRADEELETSVGHVDVSMFRDIPVMVLSTRNRSSFWDPNEACLKALCRQVGFDIVRTDAWGRRQLVVARALDHKVKGPGAVTRSAVQKG